MTQINKGLIDTKVTNWDYSCGKEETKDIILGLIKKQKQWHKGECRGFKDCSICLFLKEQKQKIKEM